MKKIFLKIFKTPKSSVADKESLSSPAMDNWLVDEYEGQLAVDVYETVDDIVVKSAIAGVKPEELDISLDNDTLTIRGKREQTTKIKDEDYLYRECYWGGFSRSVVLPTEVKANKLQATLRNGVLTITLPKARKTKVVEVRVKEIE